ncbi:MAG TPA: phosphotransferase family protein, partial [Acidimicrobiia bacterium]|nr:phosphotransferase family protein [Acidimicrobiia bacterium]
RYVEKSWRSLASFLMTAPEPQALQRVMERACGAGTVTELRRLSGGASRETWSFDVVGADGTPRGFILRRDPGSSRIGSTTRATEYSLLRAAADVGVPVPRVRVLLNDADGLGEGFVMDRIEGETIPRKILRDGAFADARPQLAAQAGAIAARIHTIDPATVEGIVELDPPALIAQYRSMIDTFGEPHPAFELALRWLDEHRPPPSPSRVVHGDFRNGNFIIGPEGIRAVLDWELAHAGDPAEDLGWICVRSWRFGHDDKVVGGFGTINELRDAYEAAGGPHLDDDTLRFWTVLGTLKWGVICIGQSFTHLSGIVRSVELATIGRRIAETEWDLLNLLDGEW